MTNTLIHLALLFILASSLLSTPSLAWIPNPYCCVAYTAFEEKILYVQGGAPSRSTGLPQFFSLDLAQTGWKTSNPPWVPLTVGDGTYVAPSEAYHSMTVSKDGNRLTLWAQRSGIYTYDVPSASWLEKRPLPENHTNIISNAVYQSVTEPSTGLIYLPSASHDGAGMFVYNTTSDKATSLSMPPSNVINGSVSGYTFQWCSYRNSMLLYGGTDVSLSTNNRSNTHTNPYLIEYQPVTNNWKRLTPKGPSPGALMFACMAPAYGGSKMILFGGQTFDSLKPAILNGPQGAIYILDVLNMVWTRGPDIDRPSNRSSMACAVAGDNFVAWGGKNYTAMLDSTVIFNIKDNIWTDIFRPSRKTNGASIGGGVAAAAVLVAVFVGVFLYHHKRKRRTQAHADKHQVLDSEQLLVPDERSSQTITLESLKHSEQLRRPEYLAPKLEDGQRYQQYDPALNNNPQFVPRIQYQGLPYSDPQLVIPRDPQFRLNTPQEDVYALHRRPQNYRVQPGLIIAQPQFPSQPLSLAEQRQRYWQELERLRIAYQRLENANTNS
ncbi:hypothetical protein BGX29_009045 [Mortierella sp. GBA35]|nr:hypothetical protein BGX29_009045 [Mortierella sp. GBA35]